MPVPDSLTFLGSALKEMTLTMFGYRRRCLSDSRLDGKIVVITGANTGIGKETAYELSLRRAKIIIGCRDLNKAEIAINDIKDRNPNADIIAMKLDLSSLASVRQFAKEIEKKVTQIDILINNAGVALIPEWETEDGFEMAFGTNHLGHFLLTLLLIHLLKKAPKARIINVSSSLHMIGKINFENINLRNGAYNAITAYCQSKLANILFTRELAKRLGEGSTVNVYSLHPGAVNTDVARNHKFRAFFNFIAHWLYLSPHLGCQTTVYCAVDEELADESGYYYDNCKRIDNMVSKAVDDRTAEKLWELSCDLVKLEAHLKMPFHAWADE